MIHKVERYYEKLQIPVAIAAGVATIAISVVLMAGGLGRSFFSQPLKGDYEITEVVLPWIIFLSFGYALMTQAHVRVSLLFDRFPPRMRLIIDIVIGIIGLFVCVLLITKGHQFVSEAFIQHLWKYPGLLRLPSWIAWVALPIGLALMAFRYILGIVKDVARLRPEGGRTSK